MTRLSRIARTYPNALGLFVLLVGAQGLFALMPPATVQGWRDWCSTSVVNLEHHPIPALVLSTLFSSDDQAVWIALAVASVAVVDRVLGWQLSLALLALAHVGGTLVSEVIVNWRVDHALLPASALTQDDVGPSYVVVCALTISACWGWLSMAPLGVRAARVGLGVVGLGGLAPYIFAGLTQFNVSAVGHVCSVLTGSALAGLAIVLRRGRLDVAARASAARV